jgi:hypothetical protein
LYEGLAQEFGFDLKEGSAATLTIEQLQKDGGRLGGECDLTAAAKKSVDLGKKFEVKYNAGQMSPEQQKLFSAEMTQVGTLMYSSPSQACQKMKEMEPRYGF